jgi:hypothetical protein
MKLRRSSIPAVQSWSHQGWIAHLSGLVPFAAVAAKRKHSFRAVPENVCYFQRLENRS